LNIEQKFINLGDYLHDDEVIVIMQQIIQILEDYSGELTISHLRSYLFSLLTDIAKRTNCNLIFKYC